MMATKIEEAKANASFEEIWEKIVHSLKVSHYSQSYR